MMTGTFKHRGTAERQVQRYHEGMLSGRMPVAAGTAIRRNLNHHEPQLGFAVEVDSIPLDVAVGVFAHGGGLDAATMVLDGMPLEWVQAYLDGQREEAGV